MENMAYERYKWINRQLEEDEELLCLLERLRNAQPEFQVAMETLSPENRQNVTEYLGILGEITDRITELCCCAP